MSYRVVSNEKLNDESFYIKKPNDFRYVLKNYDPSLIKHRLPNVVFTGPNTLYNQRVSMLDCPHEIGIGKASSLRSLDIRYLTRGQSGTLVKQRKDMPGEIGWSANYFKNFYSGSQSFTRPNSNYVPR
ncbi:hypothetical protein BpHYR1_004963 [Brachionus plicatilis]|uniref:Uncharacterized protein n=1 Tax=Brachionus plicatilis TaxID=10195 RepID=A0A3M7RN42_BRAPC|nr:hypothetical protein BpHYR1_004963 [Brachionus plicatilis]